MKTRTVRGMIGVCALALTLVAAALGGGVARAASPTAGTMTGSTSAAQTTGVRAARVVTPAETERYAARERQAAPALAQFEGGDTFIITAGTTTLIVLLVILVVIL